MLTYKDLGVKTFINASGTITTLGGSLMPKPVLDAMHQAAQAFVDLNQLHEKAGEKLAEMIGVPAAFISCGAASGMQLAAAACLTGTDWEKIRRLPHTEGMKNEFVIALVDGHTYIHQGMEVVGGKLVRVGSTTAVTVADIIGGINQNTAAVVHFLGRQTKAQLFEVLEETQQMGVPVIVDAAAQLPPRSNLTEIVERGADLVVFSGGKGIYGPQCTGLVVGKKEPVEAASRNSSPYSAIGRGMKVGKEEIMGLLTAVELFLARDDAEDFAFWEQQMTTILHALEGIAGVKGQVLKKEAGPSWDIVPKAQIDFHASSGKTAEQIVRILREGEPSILVRRSGEGILIDPMTLLPGEEEIIARRLIEAVREA